MKVSVNWIREYLNFDLPPTHELVERIGAQLGAVEEVIDLTAKYKDVIIAKVVHCDKLENSDHLNRCLIDDNQVVQNVERNQDGLVQVVCGAPNVRAGAVVAWLPPGATVPSTYSTDPFVLEARELRGAMSNGMLASPKELDFGDNHDGILLLADDDASLGQSLATAFKLDDQIIDIENKMFTHRPDCFGQLGVAREVAGILGQSFTSPDWYLGSSITATNNDLPLTVQNQTDADVPRFMAVALKDVVVTDSPAWLQAYLSRVGVRPINNLVDITNYIMLLTGQPLHAYDYDKVAALTTADGATLIARHAQSSEQLELLSGKKITPRNGAIVIATDQRPIGLGGVMGGASTEVDSTTQNIILECATFNMYSIRRTSMAHGLFTDAVTRYNKGQSSLQNPAVMAQAVALFGELAGGTVASAVLDIVSTDLQPPTVIVAASFITDRLGLALNASQMAQLLTNAEFQATIQDEQLHIVPPFWRTDIEQPEDIVEEVGRLHGFDKLPLELPKRTITPNAKDALLQHKTVIRNSLVAAGANELLTYSFVPGNLLQKAGQPVDQAFKVSNALSPDLQYYRYSALASLLDKVHANIKAGYDQFALFEIAKGHNTALDDEQGLPRELETLDFVYANSRGNEAGFYMARRYLDQLADDLGLTFSYSQATVDTNEPLTASFDSSRMAAVKINEVTIGYVGEFKTAVRKQLKLPVSSAGFTIDRSVLLIASQQVGSSYQALPRFPKIEQDICLRVLSGTTFTAVQTLIQATLQQEKPDQTMLTITLLDIYQKDSDTKQMTFRIALASYIKTMTDAEMNTLLEVVAQKANQDLGATRV